jgi:hypothetical protein
MTTAIASPAAMLLKHVLGENPDVIGLFSGVRPEPGAKALMGIHEHYATDIREAITWLEREARESGRDTFFCAHPLTAPRRIKANAGDMWAAYVDGDGAQVPDWMPQPTAMVESSPGRHHYYWRFTRLVAPTEGEAINKRLAYAIGADRSGWDLTQGLRPPGFRNWKYDGAPLTQIVTLTDNAYDPDELLHALPPLPEKAAPISVPTMVGTGVTDAFDRRRHHLLISDGGKWAQLLNGNYDGYAGRSEAWQAVVSAAVARWMTDDEIRALLVGTAIYSSRVQDKGQYHVDDLIDTEIAKARAFVTLLPNDPGQPPAPQAPFQDDTVPQDDAGLCVCCTDCADRIRQLEHDLAVQRAVIAGERERRRRAEAELQEVR